MQCTIINKTLSVAVMCCGLYSALLGAESQFQATAEQQEWAIQTSRNFWKVTEGDSSKDEQVALTANTILTTALSPDSTSIRENLFDIIKKQPSLCYDIDNPLVFALNRKDMIDLKAYLQTIKKESDNQVYSDGFVTEILTLLKCNIDPRRGLFFGHLKNQRNKTNANHYLTQQAVSYINNTLYKDMMTINNDWSYTILDNDDDSNNGDHSSNNNAATFATDQASIQGENARLKDQITDLTRDRDDARNELNARPTQDQLNAARAEVPQSAKDQIADLTRERDAARDELSARPTQDDLNAARAEVPQSAKDQIADLTRERDAARDELSARPTQDDLNAANQAKAQAEQERDARPTQAQLDAVNQAKAKAEQERDAARNQLIPVAKALLEAGLNIGAHGLLESIATLHGFSGAESSHRWTDSTGIVDNISSVTFPDGILTAGKTVTINYGTFGEQGENVEIYLDDSSIGSKSSTDLGNGVKQISFVLENNARKLGFKVPNPQSPGSDSRLLGFAFQTMKIS